MKNFISRKVGEGKWNISKNGTHTKEKLKKYFHKGITPVITT